MAERLKSYIIDLLYHPELHDQWRQAIRVGVLLVCLFEAKFTFKVLFILVFDDFAFCHPPTASVQNGWFMNMAKLG